MADMTMGGTAAPEPVVNTTPAPDAQATDAVVLGEDGQPEGGGGEPEPKAPWEGAQGGDWDGVPKGARKRIQKQSHEIGELRAVVERQNQMIERVIGHVQAQQPEYKREDFASEEEYLDYRMEQRESKKASERQRAEAESRARNEPVERMKQEWLEKVQVAKAEGLADYEQVVRDAGLRLSTHELGAVSRSEFGPQIMYTLAKNPGLALSLEDMAPQDRMQALGRIESDIRAWKQRAKPALSQPPAAAPATPAAPAVRPAVPPPPPRASVSSGGSLRKSTSWIEERNSQFGIH